MTKLVSIVMSSGAVEAKPVRKPPQGDTGPDTPLFELPPELGRLGLDAARVGRKLIESALTLLELSVLGLELPQTRLELCQTGLEPLRLLGLLSQGLPRPEHFELGRPLEPYEARDLAKWSGDRSRTRIEPPEEAQEGVHVVAGGVVSEDEVTVRDAHLGPVVVEVGGQPLGARHPVGRLPTEVVRLHRG